ncbi:MAG: hypothetical protein ACOY7P_01935 [Pseudomonadota bacterium]
MKKAYEGTGRVWMLAACLAVLSGCQKQEGPMENAGRKIDEAGDKLSRDADRAGEKIDEATQKAGEKIQDAVAK